MFMTHFNSTDPGRPSFFEMIAQSQLMPLFDPAFKYLFSVLAQRYVSCEWVVRYHDEIFAATRLIIERHYLQHYDASFSENFYGLKRARPTPQVGKSLPIDTRDRNMSLFLLVVVPYLKTKTDNLYKQTVGPLHSLGLATVSAGDDSLTQTGEGVSLGTKMVALLRRLFILGYPFFNAVYEGLFFIYQLLYLYDHVRYYTPFLHLQRLEVKRLSMEDLILQQQSKVAQRSVQTKVFQGLGIVKYLARFLLSGWHFILDYAPYILPISVFLFRFLEWWYTENRLPPPSVPTPPPPAAPKAVEGGIKLPSNKRLCAICSKERTNPAMIPSGYVFCYPCIFNYIESHNMCPVTCLPTTVEQVRKIYEPN